MTVYGGVSPYEGGSFHALDPATESVQWRVGVEAGGSSPAVHGNTVHIGTNSEHLAAYGPPDALD